MCRFCRICYFFEQDKKGKPIKMFHGQWFVHGSKTILQETAHSKSLYLTNKCEDNPAASIYMKCKLTMLLPDDEVIPDDREPESNDFHCGFVILLLLASHSHALMIDLFGMKKALPLWTFLDYRMSKRFMPPSQNTVRAIPVASKTKSSTGRRSKAYPGASRNTASNIINTTSSTSNPVEAI